MQLSFDVELSEIYLSTRFSLHTTGNLFQGGTEEQISIFD